MRGRSGNNKKCSQEITLRIRGFLTSSENGVGARHGTSYPQVILSLSPVTYLLLTLYQIGDTLLILLHRISHLSTHRSFCLLILYFSSLDIFRYPDNSSFPINCSFESRLKYEVRVFRISSAFHSPAMSFLPDIPSRNISSSFNWLRAF